MAKRKLSRSIQNTVKNIKRLRDVDEIVAPFSEYEYIERANLAGMEMGEGIAEIDLHAPDELYDEILKEIVGEEIRGKDHLFNLCKNSLMQKRNMIKLPSAYKWLNKQATASLHQAYRI